MCTDILLSKLKEKGDTIQKAQNEIYQKTGEHFSDTYLLSKKAIEFGLAFTKKIKITKKKGGLSKENKLARIDYCYWLSNCDPAYFV